MILTFGLILGFVLGWWSGGLFVHRKLSAYLIQREDLIALFRACWERGALGGSWQDIVALLPKRWLEP